VLAALDHDELVAVIELGVGDLAAAVDDCHERNGRSTR
jgi:hypothetical protein